MTPIFLFVVIVKFFCRVFSASLPSHTCKFHTKFRFLLKGMKYFSNSGQFNFVSSHIDGISACCAKLFQSGCQLFMLWIAGEEHWTTEPLFHRQGLHSSTFHRTLFSVNGPSTPPV